MSRLQQINPISYEKLHSTNSKPSDFWGHEDDIDISILSCDYAQTAMMEGSKADRKAVYSKMNPPGYLVSMKDVNVHNPCDCVQNNYCPEAFIPRHLFHLMIRCRKCDKFRCYYPKTHILPLN